LVINNINRSKIDMSIKKIKKSMTRGVEMSHIDQSKRDSTTKRKELFSIKSSTSIGLVIPITSRLINRPEFYNSASNENEMCS
jgi:hypothetical protein